MTRYDYKIFAPCNYGKLFYGSVPSDETLIDLFENDVQVIWNLLEDNLYSRVEKRDGFHVVHTPIPDYSVPKNMEQFMRAATDIGYILMNNKRVFVHCFSGHGRTGIALATIAMLLCGADADNALQLSRIYCKGPETLEQEGFVRTLWEAIGSNSPASMCEV